MSALRAYPRLRNADHLRAWLYTIAQRKATDLARRRSRRPTQALGGVEPVAAPATGADDGLWAHVGRLPVKQRTAVIQRFALDLAYAEIAARMGTSEEAARQNVRAGLMRLRREVAADEG